MTMHRLRAIVAVMLPFIIFAGVLFWADLHTPARGPNG